MTIIILATVLAAIVGVSILVIRQLRLSRNINHSILAYYAAETGIERGLYDVRIGRLAANTLAETQSAVTDNEGILVNLAEWSTEASQSASSLGVSLLKKDQAVQFSLFNPDNFEQPADAGPIGVHQITASWQEGADARLELTVFELDQDGKICEKIKKEWWDDPTALLPDNYYLLDVDEIDLEGDLCFQSIEDIFQIRARALDNDIYHLQLTAYAEGDDNPLALEIENGINIVSTGDFSRSRQAIEVTVPWQLAASGLLDYVIFSQEELIKVLE